MSMHASAEIGGARHGVAQVIGVKTAIIAACLVVLGLPVSQLPEFIVLFIGVFLIATARIHGGRRRLAAVALVLLAGWGLAQALRPPSIEEGFNVFLHPERSRVYAEGLPASVMGTMSNDLQSVLERAADCDVRQTVCWRGAPAAKALYAFSAEGALWGGQRLTRNVRTIAFNQRNEVFAPAINQRTHYNFYEFIPGNLLRDQLPVFIEHRFPPAFDGARLCWRGTLHLQVAPTAFRTEIAEDERCLVLAVPPGGLTTYAHGVRGDRAFAMTLHRPWRLWAADYASRTSAIGAVLIALALLLRFDGSRRQWPPLLAVTATLAWCVIRELADARTALLLGLPIYVGGMDGLTHDSFARAIVHHLQAGDWLAALRGEEGVFYFQPGLRYFLALGKILFGETLYAYLLVAAALIVVLYRLLESLLPRTWAIALVVAFVCVPGLEGIAFSFQAYIKEVNGTHAEPLGYCAFLAGLTILVRRLGDAGARRDTLEGWILFLCGAAFAVADAMRPNLLPGIVAVTGAYALGLVRQGRWLAPMPLLAGCTLLVLVTAHNVYFGGRFVLLSDVVSNPFNLTMPPGRYVEAARDLLAGRIGSEAVQDLRDQLAGWLPLSRAFRWPAVVAVLMALWRVEYGPRVRIVALAAVAQHAVLMFYNAGGRYAMLAWLLSFVVLTVVVHREGPGLLRRAGAGLRAFRGRQSKIAASEDPI